MNLGAFPTISVPEPRILTPGGRITLLTRTPVLVADRLSASIYWTPVEHAWYPIIRNGVVKLVYAPDDLKLGLTTAITGDALFDVFGTEISGRPRIVAGPAWATSTAGAGDRGTTPGGTELTRAAGMLVNRWGIPGINAEGSCFVEPLSGTYLGTFLADPAGGAVTEHVTYAQGVRSGPWNAWNRRRKTLKCGDTTASWTYSTASWRISRNTAANAMYTVCGLAEERILFTAFQNGAVASGPGPAGRIGIGYDSISSPSGFIGQTTAQTVGASNPIVCSAKYEALPSIGRHDVSLLEYGATTGSWSFYGGEDDMLLTASWMA